MSLAAELQAGPPPDPRRRCGIARWLATQTPEDRATFEATLDGARRRENGWTVAALCVIAQANGLTLNADRLRAHASGGCACGAR